MRQGEYPAGVAAAFEFFALVIARQGQFECIGQLHAVGQIDAQAVVFGAVGGSVEDGKTVVGVGRQFVPFRLFAFVIPVFGVFVVECFVEE